MTDNSKLEFTDISERPALKSHITYEELLNHATNTVASLTNVTVTELLSLVLTPAQYLLFCDNVAKDIYELNAVADPANGSAAGTVALWQVQTLRHRLISEFLAKVRAGLLVSIGELNRRSLAHPITGLTQITAKNVVAFIFDTLTNIQQDDIDYIKAQVAIPLEDISNILSKRAEQAKWYDLLQVNGFAVNDGDQQDMLVQVIRHIPQAYGALQLYKANNLLKARSANAMALYIRENYGNFDAAPMASLSNSVGNPNPAPVPIIGKTGLVKPDNKSQVGNADFPTYCDHHKWCNHPGSRCNKLLRFTDPAGVARRALVKPKP